MKITCLKKLFFLVLILLIDILFSQAIAQVAISSSGSIADSSAMLDVKSSNKGILVPRVNSTQRTSIVNPADGLLVYDTDTQNFWYYKSGSGWTKIIGENYWEKDLNGIYYNSGKVGIGSPGSNPFSSTAELTINGSIDQYSNNTFQTVTRFRNTSSNQEYQFNLAGSNNIDFATKSFGLYNATLNNWLWNSDGTNSNIAIGSYTYKQQVPKSRLHVFNGDVNINDIGKGIIMKSANGQCWRITVSDTGTLVSNSIPCP